jgi:DNA-binding NtrC family response regulator
VTIDRPACADPWTETGAPIAAAPCPDAPPFGVKEIVRALVGSAIAEVERELILETLTRTCGNRTRAAGMLGISIRTLRNKIRGYQAGGLTVMQPAGNAANAALPQLSCE